MNKILSLFVFILFLFSYVSAEKLCIKKTQKLNNNKVRLSKILKTQSLCPRGYIEVLDTSIFRGPAGVDGQNGEDGEGSSSTLTSGHTAEILTTSIQLDECFGTGVSFGDLTIDVTKRSKIFATTNLRYLGFDSISDTETQTLMGNLALTNPLKTVLYGIGYQPYATRSSAGTSSGVPTFEISTSGFLTETTTYESSLIVEPGQYILSANFVAAGTGAACSSITSPGYIGAYSISYFLVPETD